MFADEDGRPVRSGEIFTGRPVLLVLAYYNCPDLCPMTLRHLTEGLNAIRPRAGEAFDVVVVSFDPRDTPAKAASQRAQYVRAYKGGDPLGGWHFLTGTQDAVDRLRAAVGFQCTYDAAHRRYAHAAAVIAVAPGGRLSHYFFGVDYAPADLENAIRDAAAGRSTTVDQPDQQYCFAYDPAAARRGRVIVTWLRCLGAAWVVGLLGYIAVKLTREFRQRPPVLATSGEGARP